MFYIFAVLPYNCSLRGKEFFAKEPEPGVFGPLEPEPLEKKYQEPEPLEKKSGAGAGATKKYAGSPALLSVSILPFHVTDLDPAK